MADRMWTDLRFAARLLAKDSRFTVTAVLVLAIGMAATTTMFALGNGVYLRDLPFATPDRIVTVGARSTLSGRTRGLSFSDLQDLRTATRAFDGIGIAEQIPVDLADAEHAAERFVGGYVSANMFPLIGERPILGRDFMDADDRPGAAPTVILGYRVWQRRYGGAPDIVGRAVRVNGAPATVIGVMRDGFGFPTNAALWLPAAPGEGEPRGTRYLDAVGRLAEGVTIAQADEDLATIMSRLAREYPETNADMAPLVRPFRDLSTSGAIRVVFTGLMAAVVLLLLLACANVANLLLARGAARGREVAVRLSLGATRRQIMRQFLTESLLLALIAGTLGLLGASFGVRLVQAAITGTGEPYWLDFPMDGRVFAFFAATCLGTAVLVGFAPARHLTRAGLTDVLNETGRAITGSVRARRLTDGLVVLQIAVSLTLLTGAGLMTQHVLRLSRLDPGVDAGGLLRASMSLPQLRYPSAGDHRLFYRRLGERLAATPGLRAGITSNPPLFGGRTRGVSLGSMTPREPDNLPTVLSVAIGPGYLEALGLAPIRGRLFSAADEASPDDVAIVSDRFAGLHFPGEAAVGQIIQLGPSGAGTAGADEAGTGPLTIVGVVPDLRQASPRQDGREEGAVEPVVYVSWAADPRPEAQIVIRSDLDAAVVTGLLRDAVAALDADLPAPVAMGFNEAIAQELAILAAFGSMFGLFAAAALGLAAIGLYAVAAFAVAQRTRELGIRIALGARARHVWWLVTSRAARQLAVGIAVGLVGALAAGRLLAGIRGVSSQDPLLLVGLPGLVAAIALAACVGPARRATRLDPAATLRAE
jgi:predicted permease